MGVNGGWRVLVGQVLASMKKETVDVAGKSVCWEVYGTLHRLLQGYLNVFPEERARAGSLAASSVARGASSLVSPSTTALLMSRVFEDVVQAGTTLLDTLGARHVHVVLEGMHPAKATTHKKRRERTTVRPTDSLVRQVESELRGRFPGRVTVHRPPHDADSQLAYLCATGLADYALVPSNDCDMALFHGLEGRLVLTPSWSNSSTTGIEGVVYRGPSGDLEGFDIAMLRCFAVISGCDYFNCRNFGPKKAAQLVRRTWEPALSPQDNCDRVQAAMGKHFEPSTVWQVSTLAEAYSCFACQLVRTVEGDTVAIDETSGVTTPVTPAPILLPSAPPRQKSHNGAPVPTAYSANESLSAGDLGPGGGIPEHSREAAIASALACMHTGSSSHRAGTPAAPNAEAEGEVEEEILVDSLARLDAACQSEEPEAACHVSWSDGESTVEEMLEEDMLEEEQEQQGQGRQGVDDEIKGGVKQGQEESKHEEEGARVLFDERGVRGRGASDSRPVSEQSKEKMWRWGCSEDELLRRHERVLATVKEESRSLEGLARTQVTVSVSSSSSGGSLAQGHGSHERQAAMKKKRKASRSTTRHSSTKTQGHEDACDSGGTGAVTLVEVLLERHRRVMQGLKDTSESQPAVR